MKRLLYALFGLLLGGVASLLGLLYSEAGSRWLLGQVGGLQVLGSQGHLAGTWQARTVRWETADLRLQLDDVQLSWTPACLWRLQLCVERLQAARLAVYTTASEEPAARQALRLPVLDMPLAIALHTVQLDALYVQDELRIENLQLRARWQGHELQVEALQLRQADLQLHLSGVLQTVRDWPLQATAHLALAAPSGQDWNLALQLHGDLQQRLHLQMHSSGYLQAQGEGWLQPLAEHWPARLQVQASDFLATPTLPATLRMEHVQLDLQGDLQSGYALQGQASLAAEQQPMSLLLDALLTAQGLQLKELRLGDRQQGYLQVHGEVDWQSSLAVQGQLDWQDLPWQRLWPQLDALDWRLRRLQGPFSYQDGRYQGELHAEADGPAGPFTLHSPFAGDLQRVQLADVRLQAGRGQASGRLELSLGAQAGWSTHLQLRDIDPAYWQAGLPGRIAGSLHSEGQWQPALQGRLVVDLHGQVRQQPLRWQATLQAQGEQWSLAPLQLQLGDNRIDGQASLGSGQRLAGELRWKLPALQQLWPELAGRVQGQLQLAGTRQRPQGQLQLQGQALRFQQLRLASVQLDARLDARQQGTLRLQSGVLRQGDRNLGEGLLSGAGTWQRHQLDLDWLAPDFAVNLQLSGAQQAPGWRGELRQARVQLAELAWQLQAPTAVRFNAQAWNLAAHCWQAEQASLCAGAQRLWPDSRLDYRLRQLPMSSLAGWWPEDFDWQGQLDGELQLQLTERGPRGQLRLDAGQGQWRLREQGQWLAFPYQQLHLHSRLQPHGVEARLWLDGERLGQFELDMQIDPRTASKPLRGQYRLTGLDIGLARPFVSGLEALEGRLQGQGRITGSLLAPWVEGDLQLLDGRVAGAGWPLNLDALAVQIQIVGQQLEVQGNWRSGELGRGQFTGQLGWHEALRARLAVSGSQLPVVVEPYANLQVEPRLQLQLDEQGLALSGEVDVPSGLIEVRELPAQAVRVSADVEVVGAAPASERNLPLAMDVRLRVGAQRLRFRGFGLTAEVRGQLHITDQLRSQGELELLKGRYQAYGQRLNVRRARLLFNGALDRPFLDIEAVRKVGTVSAGVRVSGSADQPLSQVFADPPMSEEQALSYLVLGRPLGSRGDGAALGSAALAMGLSGSLPFTGQLAERLGIDDFQLGSEGASGRFSERLSLRYGLGSLEQGSLLAVRYELSKRLYLEAASGLASSLDLVYRHDF